MSEEVAATIIGAVIGGLIGVAGTCFGAVITNKLQMRTVAGHHLRAAFQEELAILSDPRGDTDPCNLLKSAYRKHLAAITEFRFFLTPKNIKSFDKAWNDYHCYNGEQGKVFFEQYSKHGVDTLLAGKKRSKAIEQIERILSFTNS